jgi:uncharacterized protein (DUF2267 family)
MGNADGDSEIVGVIAVRSGLSIEQAHAVTHAAIETLADRLSGGEALDLMRHLPSPLRPAPRPKHKPADGFGLDEFIRRVSTQTGLPLEQAEAGIRAVLGTLRELLPAEEFEDVAAQLPREIGELALSAG